MGLFRRAATRPGGPTPDPAHGDPAARWLIDAAQHRDAPAISEFLRGVDHPDDRSFYCSLLGRHAPDGSWLDDWVAAEPRSATPLTVAGIRAVHRAWEARGAQRAKNVSRAAFTTFFERLAIAQALLDRSVDLDRDDPTPWMGQVIIGRASELGPAETRRRFDEVRRRHLWHVEAHEHMLQQLCAKWGGSHQQMHEFAEATVAAAPAGARLGHLVAEAHLESWLDLRDGADARFIQDGGTGARLRAAADRSVNHPAYERRPGWVSAENSFAMLFSLNRDLPSAATRFRVIGDLVTEHPWDYLGDAGSVFAEARADALG